MTARLLFLTTLLLAATAPAQALDCTFNVASGNWETAANWDCGVVPDANDDVTITSSRTVTLNSNHTVGDLSFLSGTIEGSGTLTVAGDLTWNFGTLNTDLHLLASGSGSLASSTKTIGDNATLRLDADTDWSSGQIVGGAGAVLDNNATLTSTTNSPMTWSTNPTPRPVFDNDGAFVYNGSSQASNFFVLANGSTVEVQQGTSTWREGGGGSGSFDVAAGATLDFNAGTFDLTVASISGAGTIDFSGTETTLDGTLGGLTGTMQVSGGTLNLNANETVDDFDFLNGTINGPGTLTVAGDLTWNFGTLNTDLHLLASGSGTLASSSKTIGDNATLRLDADTDWSSGQIVGGAGAVLDNNATLTSTTNSPMTWSTNPTPRPRFDNDGAFVYNGSSQASNFFVLDNDGAVEVQQGISTWREGGSGSGSFDVAAGATLDFSTGTFMLTNVTLSGAGTIDFSGTETTLDGTLGGLTGTMQVSGGTLNLNANETVNDLDFLNGTINGPGSLTVAGDLLWNFGTLGTDLRLLASGSGTLASSSKTIGDNATLRLDADTDWSSGQIVGGAGAVLDNNATLTSMTNSPMTWSTNPTPRPVFDNDGAFVYNGSSQASNFFVLDNGSTIEVQQGTSAWREGGTNNGAIQIASGAEFDLSGAPLFTNAVGGVIGGDGTFDDPSPTASFTNNGTFAPGASPGLLTYDGNFEMTASSVLAIEIGGGNPPVAGDDYDQLAVVGNGFNTGDAVLAGTLRLSVAVGDAPAIGDTYTILTTANGDRLGTFDTIDGPFGYTFDVDYNATSVTVEVLTVPNFDLAAVNTNPTGDPIVVVKPGTIDFAYAVTNNTNAPITGDVFFTASLGATMLAQGVILSGTLPANASSPALSFTQGVPGIAPNGTYTYSIKIGQFPSTVVDQVDFTVVVTSAARPGEEGDASESWSVREATPWLGADGSVLMAAAKQDGVAVETEETADAAVMAVPETFDLTSAYPNPFRSSTTFALDVPEASRVTVAVYDALGRRVAVLLDGEVEAGTHRLDWRASSLPSGVYLVRATGARATAMQRVTLVR